MKSTICTLLFFGLSLTCFSQEIWFDVRGIYGTPVPKERINLATNMKDINSDYPSSWITESNYIFTKITTHCNDETSEAIGANAVLSSEQLAILRDVDFFTKISVEVEYYFENFVTKKMDTHTMNFSVTVVPKIEATYIDGYDKMKTYLKATAVDKITEMNMVNSPTVDLKKMQAIVRFIVDENGQVKNPVIGQTSTHQEIDNVLLESIQNMGNWFPAEDQTGAKMEQAFEFLIGLSGC